MPCPFLREVVMLYCDAYPIKKMVPLDKLVTAGPCLAQEFKACPFYGEHGGSSALGPRDVLSAGASPCPPDCGGPSPARKESLR